jgi:hypothetical protein
MLMAPPCGGEGPIIAVGKIAEETTLHVHPETKTAAKARL